MAKKSARRTRRTHTPALKARVDLAPLHAKIGHRAEPALQFAQRLLKQTASASACYCGSPSFPVQAAHA